MRKRQKKRKKDPLEAAFQASVQAAATWMCLTSGWKWWERMRRETRWVVWGKGGKGKVADVVR